MDAQEQADRMAAAEALFMISNRGGKGKAESATRRSKRGRKKKEIIDYYEKADGIHTDTSEDELKLKKGKRGQPSSDNVTKSSDYQSAGKARTIGKRFSKEISDSDIADQSSLSKLSRPTPKKRLKTKSDNSQQRNTNATNQSEIHPEDTSYSYSRPNRKIGKGKLGKIAEATLRSEEKKSGKDIKALGFTGAQVTLNKSPPRLTKQANTASPRRTPSNNDEPQAQLKSMDSTTSSINLLSMNASTPEVVSLPSLPAGIGSLQLSSTPVPNLSSLSDSKKAETSANEREESQKQLPLKKRKLLGAAPQVEEKAVEDISDADEDVGVVGQVQATFTVQAHPIITMQTLMEIKTALTPDEDGDLPLHIAVVHENMRMVTKLINLMRIAVKGVDKFNKHQQTPLHLAVKLNFVPAVELLITSGGNINTVDWTGSSAIHMAVQGRFYECLELILKRSPNAETNARNFEGLSPLHLAVINRDMKQVQLLLKYGADIDLPDGKSGRTALFHAAETNQKNLVELLLKQGANPDLSNYAGVTATMAAQGRNLHSILKLIGSVVQDKQDSKWSTVTVKNQSGSVMMEVNQDSGAIDANTVVGTSASNDNRSASSSSLLQQQHPISSTLLQHGNGGDASDNKSGMYQNVVVISSKSNRRKSAEISLPRAPPGQTPEIKIETENYISNTSRVDTSSSTASIRGFVSPSSSTIPIVRVKQEVNDNPLDEASNVSLMSSSVMSASNKPIFVSNSSGLPVSISAIGLSGKPIVREQQSSSTKSKIGNTTSSSQKHQPTTLQQNFVKLSVPSPRPLSSSPISPSSTSSSPHLSFKPPSPRSPSNISSTSNVDTIALTSKQARVYQRLLELYKINPASPTMSAAGQSLPSSPPVLRSLPLLPSSISTRPPLSSSLISSNRTSPLTQSSSPPSVMPLKLSSHNRAAFSSQQVRPLHMNPPVLLQRSLSTQETVSSPRFPPTTTDNEPFSPSQRVSTLRLNNPSLTSFQSNYTDGHILPSEGIHPQRHTTLTNPYSHHHHHHHPNSQPIYQSTSAKTTTPMDKPLNLSAKNYSTTSTIHNDNVDDEKESNNDTGNNKLYPLQKNTSGGMQDKQLVNPSQEEDDTKSNLTVPEFPHITKSVSPETASFVRKHLQQLHQKQQSQHFQVPDDMLSSSDDLTIKLSSVSALPSMTVANMKSKSYTGTLTSINIPPLITSLPLTTTLTLTKSSSLPASPSSAVSTLSLPISQLESKRHISLSKQSGLIPIAPAIPTTNSHSVPFNPNFLHKSGGVIDLSTGDEHSKVIDILQNFSTNDLVSHPTSDSNNDNNRNPGQDINTNRSNDMEGKMVGFSGAIIPIPTSTSSQTLDKSNSVNRVPETSKSDKTSSVVSTTSLTVNTTTKEKGKRKGRRQAGSSGGGVKSAQAIPSTDVPVQNKINSETDQRLKKFLGLKRSEQASGGRATPSLTSSSKENALEKKEVNVPGDSVSTMKQIVVENNSSGSNDSISFHHNSNDNSSGLQTNQTTSSDNVKEQEPTIETVGIFSGSIQHVKVKTSLLKSLPSASSFKANNVSGNRRLHATHNTTAASDVILPSVTPSWPLSSKQVSSTVNCDDDKNKIMADFGSRNDTGGQDGNSAVSTITINEGDQDVYYSERIVWRSSPLLSMPSSPSPVDKQEVTRKGSSKKSQKSKNSGSGGVRVNNSPPAVVVMPPQQNNTEVFSGELNSMKVAESGDLEKSAPVEADGSNVVDLNERKSGVANLPPGAIVLSRNKGVKSVRTVKEDVKDETVEKPELYLVSHRNVGDGKGRGGDVLNGFGVKLKKSEHVSTKEVKEDNTKKWDVENDERKLNTGEFVVVGSGDVVSGGDNNVQNTEFQRERNTDNCVNIEGDDDSNRVGSGDGRCRSRNDGYVDPNSVVVEVHVASSNADSVKDVVTSRPEGCDDTVSGGNTDPTDGANRMSVDEEQDLVIDLETPTDNKSLVTT